MLQKITHNVRGTMVDQYTHWHWQPLCEAVLCLSYQQPPVPRLAVINSQPRAATWRDLHDAPHDATHGPSCFDATSGWRRRESNPGPQGIQWTLVHVRSRYDPSGGVRGFGHDLASTDLGPAIGGTLTVPSLRGLRPSATKTISRSDGRGY